jgi:hypothetical protein
MVTGLFDAQVKKGKNFLREKKKKKNLFKCKIWVIDL